MLSYGRIYRPFPVYVVEIPYFSAISRWGKQKSEQDSRTGRQRKNLLKLICNRKKERKLKKSIPNMALIQLIGLVCDCGWRKFGRGECEFAWFSWFEI